MIISKQSIIEKSSRNTTYSFVFLRGGLTTYAELDDIHIIFDDIYDCILAKVISVGMSCLVSTI